ncbi:MAG TPA: GNAT family N-acetyltransferase [Pyrinomonadaceae bacterium]
MSSETLHTLQEALTITPLTGGHEAEVLNFLSRRPVITSFMSGLIYDNGLESPMNRGSFYSCRDHNQQLVGVALFGHFTLAETTSQAARAAFASYARNLSAPRAITGEYLELEDFWQLYAAGSNPPHLRRSDLILVQRSPASDSHQPVKGLRQATLKELPLIVSVNAAMHFEQNGIDPLVCDPDGFRRRCAIRIEQGRKWVVTEGDQLVFKADIVAETPQVIHIEGVYVNPDYRGRGMGRRCLSQLGRTLLTRTEALCLMVSEQNVQAQSFYRRAGYELHSRYGAIYPH